MTILRQVENWLGLVRRARGVADGHVGRLWAQILAGTRGGRTLAGGSERRTAADVAWQRLMLLREAFMALGLLPALETVVAIAGGERGPQDRIELAALRVGVAGIAAWLRTSRRRSSERRVAC